MIRSSGGTRLGPGTVATAVLAAAVLGATVGCIDGPPEPGSDAELGAVLSDAPDPALAPGTPTASLLFTFGDPRPGRGTATIRHMPGSGLHPEALHRIDERQPVFEGAGLYLAVADASGRNIYTARVGDSRTVLGESFEGPDIEPVAPSSAAGSILALFPHVSGGELWLFDTRPDGNVETIYMRRRLGGSVPPPEGLRFVVRLP